MTLFPFFLWEFRRLSIRHAPFGLVRRSVSSLFQEASGEQEACIRNPTNLLFSFIASFLFHYRIRPHGFLLVLRLNEHRRFCSYCWPPLPLHRLGSISLIFFSVPLIKGITLSLSLSFSLCLKHFDFNWSMWTNPGLLVTSFCICSSS